MREDAERIRLGLGRIADEAAEGYEDPDETLLRGEIVADEAQPGCTTVHIGEYAIEIEPLALDYMRGRKIEFAGVTFRGLLTSAMRVPLGGS